MSDVSVFAGTRLSSCKPFVGPLDLLVVPDPRLDHPGRCGRCRSGSRRGRRRPSSGRRPRPRPRRRRRRSSRRAPGGSSSTPRSPCRSASTSSDAAPRSRRRVATACSRYIVDLLLSATSRRRLVVRACDRRRTVSWSLLRRLALVDQRLRAEAPLCVLHPSCLTPPNGRVVGAGGCRPRGCPPRRGCLCRRGAPRSGLRQLDPLGAAPLDAARGRCRRATAPRRQSGAAVSSRPPKPVRP